MKPDISKITISNNRPQVQKLLEKLIFAPRLEAIYWSNITKQTPNLRIGYTGQHLAALLTGVEGARTGARGDDLIDGTEVKSCNRIDQVDACEACKARVMRIEDKCPNPNCNSSNIKRNNDSKWLFKASNKAELDQLTSLDRILLLLFDYPEFEKMKFDSVRIQAFEIWNNSARCENFKKSMEVYFRDIYSKSKSQKPADKNFWPYSFEFYMCNPIKIFEAHVTSINVKPVVAITHFLNPKEDRSSKASEDMPSGLLVFEEWNALLRCKKIDLKYSPHLKDLASFRKGKKTLINNIPFITEDMRSVLSLRETKGPSMVRTTYKRKNKSNY